MDVTTVGHFWDHGTRRDVYHYGDVVTLTASADPAWTFVGWSGDVQSTENPLTLVVEDDTFITATSHTMVCLLLVLTDY